MADDDPRCLTAPCGTRRDAGQDRDTRAVRLVGVTFFALAAYLTAEGIASLITAATPAPSPAGLAITAAALMVMPAVAVAKRRTGRALGSRTLVADSAETSCHRRLPTYSMPCCATLRPAAASSPRPTWTRTRRLSALAQADSRRRAVADEIEPAAQRQPSRHTSRLCVHVAELCVEEIAARRSTGLHAHDLG